MYGRSGVKQFCIEWAATDQSEESAADWPLSAYSLTLLLSLNNKGSAGNGQSEADFTDWQMAAEDEMRVFF